MNTKLEAIAHLQAAFEHNPAHKKAWKSYIELSIIEAFEESAGSRLQGAYPEVIAKEAATKILNLFDVDFWQMHADAKKKPLKT